MGLHNCKNIQELEMAINSGFLCHPLGYDWQSFYNFLTAQINEYIELPLILDGYWYSTCNERKVLFRKHLQFAKKHKIYPEALTFLLSLKNWELINDCHDGITYNKNDLL